MNLAEALQTKKEVKKSEYVPIERKTMTVEETAGYLGVSKDLIYKLVRKKQIPNIKIGGRIMFKKESIDRWLSEIEQENYYSAE
ncbi:helix-turn-helix domain-containing protein [Lentibacillus sediminis]|uniref:helix-turn-helix domain-containing protein n=1 Tax=Lentibacillus sediminis TaxID=1940529 RepID=UPI00308466D4